MSSYAAVIYLSDETINEIRHYIKVLDEAANYYGSESFAENQAVILSVKFEILNFISRDDARVALDQVKEIIEANDLNSLLPAYDELAQGKTAHSKALMQITALFEAAEKIKSEAEPSSKIFDR